MSVRLLVGLVLAAHVAGCATEAQGQSQTLQNVFQSSTAAAEICVQAIHASPEFAPLRDHMPLRADRPTIRQLTDDTFVTDEQIAAIYEVQPRYQECRAEALNTLAPAVPMVAAILAEAFTEADGILVDLVRRNISWADYASRNQAAVARYQPRLVSEVQMIEANLQRSHEYELRRRQTAASAFSAWVQQQQVINGMNRTRTTNCTAVGMTVSCISH